MSSLASSYPHRAGGGGGGGGGGAYGAHNESHLSRYGGGGHDGLMASRYGAEHGLYGGGGATGYGASDGGLGSSSYYGGGGGVPSYVATAPSSHPQYHHQLIEQNQNRWGNTAVNGLLPGQNPNISHLDAASLGGGGGIKRSLDDVYLSVDGLYKRTRMETGNNLPVYPQRPGEKDCAFYMKTRNCKFGGNCKFDHPAWVPAGGIPDWKEAAPPKTLSLPVRSGEPDCVFYMKYGSCKFGENCKFNHPQDRSAGSEGITSEQNGMDEDSKVTEAEKEKNTTLKPASQFNAKGLPVRPGETDCPFYMKKGSCKYGSTCRFNHPDKAASMPVPVQQMSMDTLAAFSGGGLVGLPGFGGLTGGLPGGVFGGLPGLAGGLGHQYIGASPDFGLAGLGMGPVGNLTINQAPYPQRPGEQECSYYMKTGICKYGVGCKFNHPINRTEASQPDSKLTLAGLPRREGETTCAFYLKTGACKYGANCRFDHPPPGEVVAKALADAKKTDGDEDEEAEGDEDQSS